MIKPLYIYKDAINLNLTVPPSSDLIPLKESLIFIDPTTPSKLYRISDDNLSYVLINGSTSGSSTSGTANITPETHPTAPTTADDEFEVGTNLDTTGARAASAVPWAWINRGTSSEQLADGALILTIPASTSYSLRSVIQPLASSACKYRCKMLDVIAASADYAYGGIAFYNSANGQWMTLHLRYALAGWTLEVCHWADTSAVWSTVYQSEAYPNTGYVAHQPIWLELETDGTKMYFRISSSGVNGTFQEVLNENISAWMVGVTHVGLFANTNNSSPVTVIYDLFRRVA